MLHTDNLRGYLISMISRAITDCVRTSSNRREYLLLITDFINSKLSTLANQGDAMSDPAKKDDAEFAANLKEFRKSVREQTI